ncbi:MAG: hypothetical protein ABI273_00460 [Lacunisphaera sp.]
MTKLRSTVVLLLGTAILAVIAYWLLFTAFMAYDDEGYVLISLKNYCAHGGLYSHVYSQYGPFFYLFHDVGHRFLGYAFTNTNGRLITLIFWVGASTACAHLVWRQTRALSLAVFTAGMTYFYLWLMSSEPIHPGGMITMLVALGAWWGARQIERGSIYSLAIGSALIGSFLLLTKINVGIFFLTSAAVWFLAQLRKESRARACTYLCGVLLVVLPLGLMQAELNLPWVRMYVWLSAVASLTMLAVTWVERNPMTEWRHGGWAAGTVLLSTAAILTAVCLRGTSLHAVFDGVLINPLRHPGVYHYPPFWIIGAGVMGGISLGLVLIARKRKTEQIGWWLIAIRLLLVSEFSLAAFECLPVTIHSSVMSFIVPLAWVFALRIAPHPSASQTTNIAPWIGLLLVLQYLHAYPVAGSQIAWGTFLVVPLMALGIGDTQRFLLREKQTMGRIPIGFIFGFVAILATARLGVIGWHRYAESKPLRLEGAEDIRLPEQYASGLRLLSLNAAAQGDMLFSLPGMYSFNQWTRLPTPTLANTTHWFSLLDEQQQAAIITALEQSKRPVLIIHHGLIDFLTDSHFVIKGPLLDYVNENFTPLFKTEKYGFLIRKGRRAIPLDTAEMLQLNSPQPGMAPNRLEIVAAVPPGSKVASIELATLDDNPRILMHWDKSSASLAETPINLEGATIATEHGSAWEIPLPPLVRLDLSLNGPVTFLRKYSIVYLRDQEGTLIAEARFTE